MPASKRPVLLANPSLPSGPASKADLAAAVARRYAEQSAITLDGLALEAGSAEACLRRYPDTFRQSLENGNRICLCSFPSSPGG